MDTDHELNDKERMIAEKGMLYYLWQYTDFLCDLPEWMIPHIEEETEPLYNDGKLFSSDSRTLWKAQLAYSLKDL